ADFDGDGRLDLVVSNYAGDYNTSIVGVTVLLGNGDGTFQTPRRSATGTTTYSLVSGDFDGDGRLDLATSSPDGSVSGLLGNGDGTFQPAMMFAPKSFDSISLVAGDFNHDGRLDLAVAYRFAATVSILLNQGDGTFEPTHPVAAGNSPASIVA